MGSEADLSGISIKTRLNAAAPHDSMRPVIYRCLPSRPFLVVCFIRFCFVFRSIFCFFFFLSFSVLKTATTRRRKSAGASVNHASAFQTKAKCGSAQMTPRAYGGASRRGSYTKLRGDDARVLASLTTS